MIQSDLANVCEAVTFFLPKDYGRGHRPKPLIRRNFIMKSSNPVTTSSQPSLRRDQTTPKAEATGTAAQLPLPLIERKHADTVIRQRAKDGYVNATAMCKAAGRPWSRYWEARPSKEFATALSTDLDIPISELIQSVSGG